MATTSRAASMDTETTEMETGPVQTSDLKPAVGCDSEFGGSSSEDDDSDEKLLAEAEAIELVVSFIFHHIVLPISSIPLALFTILL